MKINQPHRSNGFMNWSRLIIGLTLLLGFSRSLSFSQTTQATDLREDQIKAIFIFNFTQFITWPDVSFAAKDAPFIITVLDNSDFSALLRKVVQGESQGTHPIVVQDADQLSDIVPSHILFIGRKRSKDLQEVIDQSRTTHTLTVSDLSDFAKRGGTIKFYMDKGKIRIQINRTTAMASALNISSKLLNIAEVIE